MRELIVIVVRVWEGERVDVPDCMCMSVCVCLYVYECVYVCGWAGLFGIGLTLTEFEICMTLFFLEKKTLRKKRA